MLLIFTGLSVFSQSWTKAVIDVEGDTLVRSGLSAVTIRAPRVFEDESVRTEYYRIMTLRRDVERVAPFAIDAAELLSSLDEELSTTASGKERRRIIKERESQIQLKLEARLQQLTRQQGEIMVKLIHRESGKTVHEWMQSIKGKSSAFYWQNVARAGGVNLKLTYDAEEEDRAIERIISGKPY